ncbi:MAG: hypothetical protein HC821_05100, partial [Lewinella sp.]|nr:hypothetical protein [Lewinella sp.]
FKNLDQKPDTCAPHGLVIGHNCLSYRDSADLQQQTAALSDAAYQQLLYHCWQWAKANSCKRRAEYFLSSLGYARVSS